jgi:hypothetical protein
MSDQFVDALLAQLEDFQRFPKYQLERRLDSVIGFFLPAVFGVSSDDIIPELPLRAHSTKRLSKNVDYALYDRRRRTVTLVELKTDSDSLDYRQVLYYLEALVTPWTTIVENIAWLKAGSRKKQKYDHLLSKVSGFPADISVEAVLLAPAKALPDFEQDRKRAARELRVSLSEIGPRWRFLSLSAFADMSYDGQWQSVWNSLSGALIRLDS